MATYRPRGVAAPQTIWNVVRYPEGMAIWWEFRTREEAREAAGIEE